MIEILSIILCVLCIILFVLQVARVVINISLLKTALKKPVHNKDSKDI